MTLLLSAVPACAGVGVEADAFSEQAATSSVAKLVPETAESGSVVLANPDGFPGTNELHYRFLRALFADPALADVKVQYLAPFAIADVTAPARAVDGDRIGARFGTRFRAELASGRLTGISSRVDSPWARDFFPMIVKDGQGRPRAVRFQYARTEAAGPEGEAAAKSLGYEVVTSDLVMEGGNVLVDDAGTLFTTTTVLKRNPAKSKDQIEAELRRVLGVGAVEWLDPLPHESTGHVDIFAKVVGRKKVLVSSSDFACGEESSPGCTPRQPTLDGVARAFERRGYEVTRIKNAETGDDPKALTYANSLLVNGTAFVPAYFDPSVAESLDYLEGEVPVRTITAECGRFNPYGSTEDAAYETVKRRAACVLERIIRVKSTPYLTASLGALARDEEAKGIYERLGFRVVQMPGAQMIQLGGSVHCLSMQVAR